MRVLILGGTGMLGHKVWQSFRGRFETWVAVRSRPGQLDDLFDRERVVEGVDAANFQTVVRAFARSHPDVVINCIGIVKQLAEATDPLISIEVNSLFPHRLADLCRATGARLLHISTDCVFSGRTGGYREDDISDADDLYGRSKLLGEVRDDSCLTLRTSIIGRELRSSTGIVEWFLSKRNQRVRGFSSAIFSGLTTAEISKVLLTIVERHPELEGLYHLSADPISKYDLLLLLNEAYRAGVVIEASDEVKVDRSLDSTRFRSELGWSPPTWNEMIASMASDSTPYETWRSARES